MSIFVKILQEAQQQRQQQEIHFQRQQANRQEEISRLAEEADLMTDLRRRRGRKPTHLRNCA